MQTQTAEAYRPQVRQPKEDLVQMVGFVVGKELFGVNILSVQEIIRETPVTAIPDSPDFIEGVINLRGNIIPVIDLRKRLNLHHGENQSSKSWIIILSIQGRVTGFVVDAVTKVIKAPRSSFSHPPDIVAAGLKSRYIRGVCRMDNRLLILLDFNRILMVDEIKKLKEMKRR
jgi:purine-binding chemotaxis protein CheW